MATTTATPGNARQAQPVLTDDILQGCRERTAQYDNENTFFDEDFEQLRDSGYTMMAVPEEFGGLGMRLDEVMRQTRLLSQYAPADALALNMHVYWTGSAADIWRSGDSSVAWILEEAAKGEIFAAGHAEGGNDIPVLLSTSTAERVDGGYRFNGRKNFGSLGPRWTLLGAHAMDTGDPENPKIVHGFIRRDAEGVQVEENWDVMGMRATQSYDTVLDGVFVPDERVARVLPAGAAGIDDNWLLSVFVWAMTGFSNVYYGMAQRALEVSIEGIKKRKSLALPRGYAYHPEYQHAIAEMIVDLEAMGPHVDTFAREWSEGVDHGPTWGTKLFALKYKTVEAAWRVVDSALELGGGYGIFRAAGLERMFRDARLGRIHPGNAFLTREFIGKLALDVDLDDPQRWG